MYCIINLWTALESQINLAPNLHVFALWEEGPVKTHTEGTWPNQDLKQDPSR